MKFVGRFSIALVISLLSIVALRTSIVEASGSNWLQWRGPDGQGISRRIFIRGEKNLYAIEN